MKKIIISAFVLLLASCAKETTPTLTGDGDQTIQITTRATDSSSWSESTELTLVDLTNNTEAIYSYSGSAWSSAAPLEWSLDTTAQIDLCGFISTNGTTPIVGATQSGVTLTSGDQVDQSSAELLASFDYQYYYGAAISQPADGDLSIKLDYALSKIVVNIVTDGTIESVQVEDTPSSMELNAGIWAAGSDMISTLACDDGSGKSFTAYVVPTSWSTPQVTITDDESNESVATYSSAIDLEASKVYTFTIIVTGEGTEATFAGNFTVEDWTNNSSLGSYNPIIINTWDGTIADEFTLGTGTEEDPYLIGSGSELALIANRVNNQTSAATVSNAKQQYAGVYFKLTSDIDLNGDNYLWTPIGRTSALGFAGCFDGAGYSIHNMRVEENDTDSYDGFFGDINGQLANRAIIKNLTFVDPQVNTIAKNAGILVGYIQNYATVDNCKVVGGELSSYNIYSTSQLGGLIGQLMQTDIIISDCHISDFTMFYESTTASTIGGIIGKTSNTATIIGSSFAGSITCDTSVSTANVYMGGIVGNAVIGSSGTIGIDTSTIVGCYSTGTIHGKISGGIVGVGYGTIIGSYSTMTATASSKAGGVVGSLNYSSSTFPISTALQSCFYTDSSIYTYGQSTDADTSTTTATSGDKDSSYAESIGTTEVDIMNAAISTYYSGAPEWQFVASSDTDFPYVIEAKQ